MTLVDRLLLNRGFQKRCQRQIAKELTQSFLSYVNTTPVAFK